MVITVTTFRLRGGQIQPKLSNCAGTGVPTFFAQTFGVDEIKIDISDAKTTLLASSDMQGQKVSPDGVDDQNYIDTTFSRASYQGRPLRTTDGEAVFSATEEHVEKFRDEDVLGL